MCMTGLLCYTVETNTTLYINYIPIKNLNKLNTTTWQKKLALDVCSNQTILWCINQNLLIGLLDSSWPNPPTSNSFSWHAHSKIASFLTFWYFVADEIQTEKIKIAP